MSAEPTKFERYFKELRSCAVRSYTGTDLDSETKLIEQTSTPDELRAVLINLEEQEVGRLSAEFGDKIKDTRLLKHPEDPLDDLFNNYEYEITRGKELNRTLSLLYEAFEDLRKQSNILAVPNCQDCGSCASKYLDEMLERDTKYVGAAYWHSQDEDSFRSRGVLNIGYFNRDESSEMTKIGEMVVKALWSKHLNVMWDGSEKRRIEVIGDNPVDVLKATSRR